MGRNIRGKETPQAPRRHSHACDPRYRKKLDGKRNDIARRGWRGYEKKLND